MAANQVKERLLRAIESITRGVEERGEPLFHGGEEPMPQKREVIAILRGLQEVIYPGYFGEQELYREYLHAHLSDRLYALARQLEREVRKALRAPCRLASQPPPQADAQEIVTRFYERLPEVMDLVAGDVREAEFRTLAGL